MSKQCCEGQTTVHWKTFQTPLPVDAGEKNAVVAHGWSQTSLGTSLSEYMRRREAWADADVAIVLASANSLRTCPSCKSALEQHFGIPQFWWSSYCQNANGYFGSSTAKGEDGGITAHISWTRFLVKIVHDADNYSWYKINAFVHWLPTRSTILLFDAPPRLIPKIPESLLDGLTRPELADPFWAYGYLVSQVIAVQDQMVWHFRTKIRTIEKGRGANGEPQPDFGRLHDLARHSVHFLETLSLATKTISNILRDHEALPLHGQQPGNAGSPPVPGVRDKLKFFETMLESLQQRAGSNHQRLHNEIQLTFNLVTQHDAKVSLQLSSAMKADGAATKSLTLLASAFLPATFICAIFSMSFFNYSAESGWVVAQQIWVYFAFAVPVTILTIVLWRFGPVQLSG